MNHPMITPTTTTITTTDEERSYTLKVQFKSEDIEIDVWGKFCRRHGLMGGHKPWDSSYWVSYPLKGLKSSEVGEILRRLNLDPVVHKVWIAPDSYTR